MDLISLEMIYFRLKYEKIVKIFIYENVCKFAIWQTFFGNMYMGLWLTRQSIIYVIIKENLTWERRRSERSSHLLFSNKIIFKQIFKQKLWYFIACCLDVKCLLMQTDGRSISWVGCVHQPAGEPMVVKFIVFHLNCKRLHFSIVCLFSISGGPAWIWQ